MKKKIVKSRMIILLSCFVLIELTTHSISYAQTQTWYFYNSENSPVPSSGVEKLKIDFNGKIWATSWEGLLQFDGIEWTVFNSENSSLPTNLVYDIEIDGENNKWIATEEGLVKFNDENWQIFTTDNSGLPTYNCVHYLAYDNDGNLWLSTSQPIYYSSILGGTGLTRFDGTNWSVYDTLNSGIPNNYVSFLRADNEGNIWFGTGLYGYYNAGLGKYDGDNWASYNTENSDLPSNIISAIEFDSGDNVWIGTSSQAEAHDGFGDAGLAKLDGTNWTIFNADNSPLTSNNITAILIDKNNNLWIGTKPRLIRSSEPNTTGGLYFYDGENWQVFTRDNSPLPSNTITSLAMDYFNNLWIVYSGESFSSDYTSSGIAVYNPEGVVVGTEKEQVIPENYLLLTNYPNPFNPSTVIQYNLAKSGQVKLTIYNLLGQEVELLVNEFQQSGRHQITWNAEGFSSGVYFCRLQSDSKTEIRKLIFLK